MKLRIHQAIGPLTSLIFIVFAAPAFGQTGSITTVAGTGTGGYNGDGRTATSAQLNGPYGISVDAAGNLYISEWYNHRIRKVDASTGTISTVAGVGGAGSGLDGIPATSTALNSPEDVAVDGAGNLYIADSLNNRVRKVNASTGVITTIAGTGLPGYSGDGGPGTAAELNDPAGVALDAAGNIYIADQSSHRIRRVDAATGIITTFAGTGEAGFSGDGGPATHAELFNPVHLTFDATGNLFIADSFNHRVRKVSSAGIITTVAGNGVGGYLGDGGPAISAQLKNPAGVAVDRSGNLYIADQSNLRIRKVDTSGRISTVAGGGTNGDGCSAISSSLQLPLDVALSPSGDRLYIADYAGNRVHVVILGAETFPATLTAISPSSGTRGSVVSVTISGSGLSSSAGSGGCVTPPTTLSISGTGVIASDVTVNSDTSLTATFTIDPNAPLGAHDVRVNNENGLSNALGFNVVAPTVPPPPPPPNPRLTSITPPGGLRGQTATVSLIGSNFDTIRGNTTVSVSGTGINVNNVNVTSPTSLTATFTVASNAALMNYGVTVFTSAGSSNSLVFQVAPAGPAFTYGIPNTLDPAQQAPVQIGLVTSSPDPVTGQLSFTFVPNAANPSDDPNVTFVNAQSNTRSLTFTIPANNTEAEMSLSDVVLQSGTVAGTIHLTVTGVQVAGHNVIPSNSTFDVTIPRLVPIITSVKLLNRTKAGFDVEITGYSTTRDITSATFQFTAAGGAHLQTVQLSPDVIQTFTTYFQSADSVPAGSSFVYTQPFIAQQGDANDVGSVTVTLANAQGSSQPKTAP